jgi:hypothetical protein
MNSYIYSSFLADILMEDLKNLQGPNPNELVDEKLNQPIQEVSQETVHSLLKHLDHNEDFVPSRFKLDTNNAYSFDFSHTDINTSTLTKILKKLEYVMGLNLESCEHITEDGLSALKHSPNLADLCVSLEISKKGVLHLKKLNNLKKLKCKKIDQKFCNELKEQFKSIKIVENN